MNAVHSKLNNSIGQESEMMQAIEKPPTLLEEEEAEALTGEVNIHINNNKKNKCSDMSIKAFPSTL